jgi:hypothetical protein
MPHPLLDTTFIILIRIDSIERIENMVASIAAITSSFDTEIHVMECAARYNGIVENLLPRNVRYSFVEDSDPILYRTRYLNKMIPPSDYG